MSNNSTDWRVLSLGIEDEESGGKYSDEGSFDIVSVI